MRRLLLGSGDSSGVAPTGRQNAALPCQRRVRTSRATKRLILLRYLTIRSRQAATIPPRRGECKRTSPPAPPLKGRGVSIYMVRRCPEYPSLKEACSPFLLGKGVGGLGRSPRAP